MNKINILIIEDSKQQAEFIEQSFDTNIYRTKIIYDGQEGLEYILKNTEIIDVVLVDYYLPNLNGLEIIKKTKSANKDVAFIFVTIDRNIDHLVMAMKAGAMDFIPKSSKMIEELPEKVNRVHQLHQASLEKSRLAIELRDSEEKFRKLFHESNDAIIIYQYNGNIIDVNKKAEEFFKYTREEFTQLSWSNIFYKTCDKNFLKICELAENKTSKYEALLLRKDSTTFYAEISSSVYEFGNNKYAQSIIRDISERKNTEEALKLSEEKFSKSFYSGPALKSITTIDEGIFIDVNEAFIKTLGYERDELIGKTSTEIGLFAKEDIKEILKYKDENSVTITNVEVELITKSKQHITCLLSIEKLHLQNQVCLIAVMLDITERKLLENKLKKLYRAVEQSPSIIVITNAKAEIEYVNPKYSEVTGYSYDFIVGKNPNIVNSRMQSKEFYHILWKTLTSGNQWQGEFANKRSNGDIYWERASISPIKNENGVITHYVKVSEDITLQKHALEALKVSEQKLREANAAKDKMFSIIGHDLRGPVGSLNSLIELIYENRLPSTKDNLGLLRDTAHSTFNLLENLLFWAKSQKGEIVIQPSHFDLSEVVSQAISPLATNARNKKISILIDMADNYIVYADVNMITTVLRNLISNAIKFTKENGTVTVSSAEKDGFIEVTVKDTGIGISEENQKKLFIDNSYFSTYGTNNERGSGLGLSLCKDFVIRNGGQIRIESEIGKGSKFIFTLPVTIV